MSLIDLFQPNSKRPGGRLVRLLDPKRAVPREVKRRSPSGLTVPPEKVRMARALRLIGLQRWQIATMLKISSTSVSEYSRGMRRGSAGEPSDAEILEAGRFAAEYTIKWREGAE